jgi:hypothetical protein
MLDPESLTIHVLHNNRRHYTRIASELTRLTGIPHAPYLMFTYDYRRLLRHYYRLSVEETGELMWLMWTQLEE